MTQDNRQQNRPSIVPQSQAQPKRAEAMTKMIQTAFTDPVKALEIGVWYGIGSTNLWLANLQEGSELVLIDAWRPYASDADISGTELRPTYWDYAKMDSLATEAFLSAFLSVKKYENENTGIDVSLIRANASKLLSMFREDMFDFIYIDADHKYDSVKQDIVNAKKLIKKDYGIICGDDLEKLPTPDLVEIARKYKDRDFIKGDYRFHPGVCLAVHEEFGTVNMIEGFWWTVCKNGEFDADLIPVEQLS